MVVQVFDNGGGISVVVLEIVIRFWIHSGSRFYILRVWI